MTTNVSVLRSGAVLLSVEAKSSLSKTESKIVFRAIVNPGEGLQRDLLGMQWNTSKLGLVLFSRILPSTTCGHAGLYFAMSDTGAGTLNVRGPTKTTQFIQAWQPFVRRKFPVLNARDVECASGKQARVERLEVVTLVSITLLPCKSDENKNGVCLWCLNAAAAVEEESSSEEEEEEDESLESSSEEEEETCEPPVFASRSNTMCYLMQTADNVIVAVVDCQDMDQNVLIENPHLRFCCLQHQPAVIVHLASQKVCESTLYQQWVAGLPKHQHVFAYQSLDSKRQFAPMVQTWQQDLHRTAPLFYPHKPHTPNNKQVVTCIINHNTPHQVTLLPSICQQDENMIDIDDDSNSVKACRVDSTPNVLFLGTGAAKPSSFRGLSACLVTLGAENSVLLDCGEDTIHQLELVGDDHSMLRAIRHVWISHHHLDHFGGVCGIIYERFHRFQARTTVLAPKSVMECLQKLFPVHMVELQHSQQAHKHLSLARTFKAIHCFDSYGIVLQVDNKYLVVYSGDTRPNPIPIPAELNPALPIVLIHEATFDDALHEEACKKKHSTLGEAMQVAKQMRARVLLLTHASQRYPKHLLVLKQDCSLQVIQAHDFFQYDLELLDSSNAVEQATAKLNQLFV